MISLQSIHPKIKRTIWIVHVMVMFSVGNFSKAQNKKITAENYLFFLHNKFVEESGPEGVHPVFGKVEYKKIIEEFTKESFVVLTEIRPKNTDEKKYAIKIGNKIDSLILSGVAPNHITVVGTSKGGAIAMIVSTLLKNEKLNFVFIACCSETDSTLNVCGNILSIYEKTDDWAGSCVTMKKKSTNKITSYKEIELNTGLKHGFQFKALKEWMGPCVQWAKENGK